MLKHVKKNDDILKEKSQITDKNKKEKKIIKELEDTMKEIEKQAQGFKGQIFEMKEGMGISKETFTNAKSE